MLTVDDGDADAAGHEDLAAGDGERRVQRRQEALADGAGLVSVRRRQERDELVAAEAGEQVVRAQRVA